MYRSRVALLALLGATLMSCRSLLPAAASPGNSACGDPCGAMVCPGGSRCTWNTNCQPRCEPQSMPNAIR